MMIVSFLISEIGNIVSVLKRFSCFGFCTLFLSHILKNIYDNKEIKLCNCRINIKEEASDKP